MLSGRYDAAAEPPAWTVLPMTVDAASALVERVSVVSLAERAALAVVSEGGAGCSGSVLATCLRCVLC